MRDRVFYWQKFDEPKMVYDPILKKDIEVYGKYVCHDERVRDGVIIGCCSANPSNGEISLRCVFILKDGGRIDKKLTLPATQEELEMEAEKYLREETPEYPKTINL